MARAAALQRDLAVLKRKAQYIKRLLCRSCAGLQMVWIIDPWMRTVTVYRPSGKVQIFAEQGILRADTVVPGFAAPVGTLFA